MSATTAVPRAWPSERVVDAACAVFAVWTLCTHAVVQLGGSLWNSLQAFGAALLVLGAAGFALRRPRPAAGPRDGATASEPTPRASRRALLCAAAVGAAWLFQPAPLPLWWLTVLVLAAACVALAREEPSPEERPATGRWLELGLWALALGCCAIALVSHRVDTDDAFYVNLAVAAADAPAAPLLAGDTLHGIPGLPLHLPVYKVHTYELWNAALSVLTGVSVLRCFHWISTALAALLMPLAFARLFRLLTPRDWLAGVLAVLVVLVAAGDVNRWYGNFALVRMWQGKSIFLSVMLPLVYAYALEFMRRPSLRGWLLLAAAQVASLGCTSSAVWAAPVAALTAACAGSAPSRRGLARLALVAVSASYVLGAGWQLKQAVELERAARSAARIERTETAPKRAARTPAAELERAQRFVFGGSHLRRASLAAVMVAWICCPVGLARRFAVVVPLAVLLTLLNPYASAWTLRNVTGASYWRAFWVLPVPILIALVTLAPLSLARGRAWLRSLACAAALAAFAAFVPATSSLSAKNRVEIGVPRLKVPREPFAQAKALTRRLAPGTPVLAPRTVNPWLATLHGRVQPLVVRAAYLLRYTRQLGPADVNLRIQLTRWTEQPLRNPEEERRFALGLRVYGVRAVLLRATPATERARGVLRELGFAPDPESGGYQLWTRS